MASHAEAVLSLVALYEKVGGITAKELIGNLGGSEFDIREAIWSLLTSNELNLTPDRKLRLIVKKPVGGRGTSGIYPVGPGDVLYNADGVAVAVVNDVGRNPAYEMELHVSPLFQSLSSGRDGTTAINQPGVVLGGSAASATTYPWKCSLNHDKLQEEAAHHNISASCPDCDTLLYTKKSPWTPTKHR